MHRLRGPLLRKLWLGLLLIIAVFLQDALPQWQLGGLRPNLPLCYIAIACLFLPPSTAALWGGLIGLLADLLAGHYLGLHVLSLALPAYGVAYGCRLVFRIRLSVAGAAVALFSLLSSLLAGLLGLIYGLSNPLGNFWGALFANLLLTPLAYGLACRLLRPLPQAAAPEQLS